MSMWDFEGVLSVQWMNFSPTLRDGDVTTFPCASATLSQEVLSVDARMPDSPSQQGYRAAPYRIPDGRGPRSVLDSISSSVRDEPLGTR